MYHQIFHNNHELIATEPRQHVAGAQLRLQTRGDGHEELVSDQVAETVVDGFEAVEFLFPYEYDMPDLAARLRDHGLKQVLFNAPPGGTERHSIDQAWQQNTRGIAIFADRQPEFNMRGTLTDEEMRRGESLIVDFTERFGKLLPIRATMRVATNKPPVHVQAIIGGSSPFVMTDDGERVMRGGEVKGNKLVIVKDSEIIFEGKERFKISR